MRYKKHKHHRRYHSRHLNKKNSLKKTLYKYQNGRCAYCQKPVPFEQFTLDHVQAQARGGKLEIGNAVGSCQPCNQGKGSKDPKAYKQLLRRYKWLKLNR